MLNSEEITKLGFEYDERVGKYFLILKEDDRMVQIDIKHGATECYFFTRMASGATLRFYNMEQLKEFLNIVKRSLRKE